MHSECYRLVSPTIQRELVSNRCMRVSACGLLWLLATYPALACTCISDQKSLCEQLRSYNGSALFVGVVQKIDNKTVLFGGNKVRQQVVTLSVEEAFAGVDGKTATVTSFAGMCGFRFRKGLRYLVDAGQIADSTYLASRGASGYRAHLNVGSCGLTASAELAADSIRFLRTHGRNPHGGIVFGTVKQYANRATFVSLSNKPISGASVLVESAPDELNHRKRVETIVDSSGYYEFVGLPDGIYTHTVQVPTGFAGELRHELNIKEGGCAQVDVRVRAEHQ